MKKPVGISIGNDWVISNDTIQFITIKKVNGENKQHEPITYWQNQGYHPTLKYALKSILDQEVLDTGLEDINKVIAKIDELKTTIENLEV